MVTEKQDTVTRYRKIMLELPPETATLLKTTTDRETLFAHYAALRAGGWTLDSMATVVGISPERVRQLVLKAGTREEALAKSRAAGLVVPELPVMPERERVHRPEPLPENIERMLELQPYAQMVRANSPRYREEAEEYTKLVDLEHNARGVSLYRLAQLLGVTHGALRFRLVRYGYKSTTSESRVYKRIIDENRPPIDTV